MGVYIDRKALRSFWIDYWCLMLNWTSFSILGFFSTAVIWAFILKHYLKVKREFLLLNDTVDGDLGAAWWLKVKNLKPGLWSAFRWWLRNHSWNFIRLFNPAWKAGEVDRDPQGRDLFEVIKSTINTSGENGRFSRADKHNRGVYYIAYKINGKTYAQYSRANWLFTFQIGTGGSEWRYRLQLNIF